MAIRWQSDIEKNALFISKYDWKSHIHEKNALLEEHIPYKAI